MKLIVLGPPLTGKSTLARVLREQYAVNALDFDQELLSLNNGRWPGKEPGLYAQLKEKVINNVMSMTDVVFFAFEFPAFSLGHAKQTGFKIFQLVADREELSRRNAERLKIEPANDAFRFVDANLRYQAELKSKGLIDRQLDACLPIQTLIETIILDETPSP